MINEISEELVRELPDMRAAIRTCVMFSGKPAKTVAYEVGIETSHLSKMLNAGPDPRHFPPEKLDLLMDVCGNEIPLRWLELKRGYSSPRKVADLEEDLVRIRRENEALRAESKVVFNVFKSVGVSDDEP